MILDPILRFNWIFYAIFSDELQHSALLSFFVGFSEVCRRGMWTLFRVENEHCTNVGRFRASRDVPLPYEIRSPSPSTTEEEPQSHPSPELHRHPLPLQASPSSAGTSSNLEAQPQSGSLRRRQTLTNTPIQRGIARVGTIMTQAHAQDFERKRKPDVPESASPFHGARTTAGVESSDEEDEEEEEEEEGSEVSGGQAEEDGGEERRANEEDVQDVQDADEILRRHRSATTD